MKFKYFFQENYISINHLDIGCGMKIKNPYGAKNFLDLVIFIIFFINICVTFARNLASTIREGPGVVTWSEKA